MFKLAAHRVVSEKAFKDVSKYSSIIDDPLYIEVDIFQSSTGIPVIREHKRSALMEVLMSTFNGYSSGESYTVPEFLSMISGKIDGVILDFKNLPLKETFEVTEQFQAAFGEDVIVASFSHEYFPILKHQLGVKTQLLCFTSDWFQKESLHFNQSFVPDLGFKYVDMVVAKIGDNPLKNIGMANNVQDKFGVGTTFFAGGVKTKKDLESVRIAAEFVPGKISGAYLDNDLATYEF